MAGKKSEKDESPDTEAPKGRSKKKMLIIIAPVVILLAAGGWFFFLRPSGHEEEPHPEPGPVVALDAITINLAGGHFLQLGLALQPIHGAEEVTGEKALDAAIDLFSGMSVEELSSKEGREHIKHELTEHVSELYEGEVYDIYFTEFVYQ
jgi:flagellar FliL protein